MTIQDKALRILSNSCLVDFRTSLDWAQWMREVAWAAEKNDAEKIERLYAEQQRGKLKSASCSVI